MEVNAQQKAQIHAKILCQKMNPASTEALESVTHLHSLTTEVFVNQANKSAKMAGGERVSVRSPLKKKAVITKMMIVMVKSTTNQIANNLYPQNAKTAAEKEKRSAIREIGKFATLLSPKSSNAMVKTTTVTEK